MKSFRVVFLLLYLKGIFLLFLIGCVILLLFELFIFLFSNLDFFKEFLVVYEFWLGRLSFGSEWVLIFLIILVDFFIELVNIKVYDRVNMVRREKIVKMWFFVVYFLYLCKSWKWGW